MTSVTQTAIYMLFQHRHGQRIDRIADNSMRIGVLTCRWKEIARSVAVIPLNGFECLDKAFGHDTVNGLLDRRPEFLRPCVRRFGSRQGGWWSRMPDQDDDGVMDRIAARTQPWAPHGIPDVHGDPSCPRT